MKQLIVDYIGSMQITPSQIQESLSKNNGRLIVSGIMQRGSAGREKNFNQNGRSYPMSVLQRESETYKNSFIAENRAMGELDHPDSEVVNLANVSHTVLDLWWEGSDLMGKIEILPTPSGNIARKLIESGIRLGISSRGMGSVKNLGEGKVEVQDDFNIICWDLVSNPSTQGAFMSKLNESKKASNSGPNYNKINAIVAEILNASRP